MARAVIIKGSAGAKCVKRCVSEMAFELILTFSSILFKGANMKTNCKIKIWFRKVYYKTSLTFFVSYMFLNS